MDENTLVGAICVIGIPQTSRDYFPIGCIFLRTSLDISRNI